MLQVNNLKLAYGKRVLFNEVNIKFRPGNCYGLIGANGAGKSTFLKIVSGEVEQSAGEVLKDANERIAVLSQDQFAFDEYGVLDTVIMGHKELFEVLNERNEIYGKEDFTDEDGIRASELEELVEKFNGYDAESEASVFLKGLGVDDSLHKKKMKELEGGDKVKVLLAQALFGNPDILLLDEPTNNLDIESINWLQDYLMNFKNTVIVVSHDRHFLNKVCTHVADIDFGKISIYAGNYSFWLQASELAMKMQRDEGKKIEDKRKELKSFIERFSSNASKAKQATSRKKLLEKLTLDDIRPSGRKYPFIEFKPDRECGKIILEVENLSKKVEGEDVIKDLTFRIEKNDKVVFLAWSHLVKTTLFQIITGETKQDSGTFRWGETITTSYFPKENSSYFQNDHTVLQWIQQFTESKDEAYARGFLGRMLFSGEESLKSVKVLSGGEKVRCMLSRMMLGGPNTIILDEPTNHLDLEAITSLNNALIKYPEVVLFTSHDYEFAETVANRIIEITPSGIIDKRMNFDDYLSSEDINSTREKMYQGHHRLML